MTRFLPIDRPLVYGDIVSYVPYDGAETPDRNLFLAEDEFGVASLIELATASGEPVKDPDEVLALPIRLLRLVVEE